MMEIYEFSFWSVWLYILISHINFLLHRLLADPAFLYRLLLEEAATIGCSVWWEFKNRKDRCVVYFF